MIPYREWAEDVGQWRVAEARCANCRDWTDLTLRGEQFYCRNSWECLGNLELYARGLKEERRGVGRRLRVA